MNLFRRTASPSQASTARNPQRQGAGPATAGRRSDAAREPVRYAVGDIHGRADLLGPLLRLIEADIASSDGPPPLLVFLGDYVDRGADSSGVIDILLSGAPRGAECVFLKGNHEAAMMDFILGKPGSRAWLSHGGLDTLVSYGVEPPFLGAGDEQVQAARRALLEAIPFEHHRFLGGLRDFYCAGPFLFAHAGMNPERSLVDQTERDLLWIREPFLSDRKPLPYRVVHGHTPVAEPHVDDRRIGVDTGAYATGILTAARLSGDAVTFLKVSAAELSASAMPMQSFSMRG